MRRNVNGLAHVAGLRAGVVGVVEFQVGRHKRGGEQVRQIRIRAVRQEDAGGGFARGIDAQNEVVLSSRTADGVVDAGGRKRRTQAKYGREAKNGETTVEKIEIEFHLCPFSRSTKEGYFKFSGVNRKNYMVPPQVIFVF